MDSLFPIPFPGHAMLKDAVYAQIVPTSCDTQPLSGSAF